jgi:hypothetical protein
MSLVYSGGPYRNDLYTGILSRQSLLTSINTTLVAAGWTSTNIFAFTELSWQGQPTAAQTVTISGQTYTYRASVSTTANEVLIGATASATALNLFNAINLGTGAGTTYGSLTAANATMSASDYRATDTSNGLMRIQAKTNPTPFGLQSAYSVSETASNQNFTFTTNTNAGYIWNSAITPAGQQTRLYGIDALETANAPRGLVIRVLQMDENEFYRSHAWPVPSAAGDGNYGYRLSVGAYSAWRVIASPYQVFIIAEGAGAPTGSGATLYAGVPYIYSFLSPRVISSATGSSPITINTSTAHEYATSDTVVHRGALGNTAINGNFSVTVTSTTQYTIPAVSSGTYTSGGVCGKLTNDKVVMSMFSTDDDAAGIAFPFNRLGSESGNSFQVLNSLNFRSTASNLGSFGCLVATPSRIQDAGSVMQFMDGSRVIYEPHMVASGTTTDKARWVGQMYDCFISSDVVTLGTTATVDSKTFYCLGSNTGTSSIARGSLWTVIP